MSNFCNFDRSDKMVDGGTQLTNTGTKVKKTLQTYLIEKRKSGQITDEELEQYLLAQRDQIDGIKMNFGRLKVDQKIEPPIFILANIEYVVSAQDFYAVQVCHLEARTEFQNILNRAYEDDCEPISNVKTKDLCVVLHDFSWCRAEVIEFVAERIGQTRLIVYLLDYGRAILTKKTNLFMLKEPHNLIKPFAMKCQLSIINKDEDELSGRTKYSLSKAFETICQSTNPVLLYMERLSIQKRDIYNVMLFTDVETNLNTVYDAYLIHEFYGAFIRQNVQFENELCEEWAGKIHQMTNHSSNDHTKKMQVHLSYVISPAEIYVRCRTAQAFLNKIRKIIDTYVSMTPNQADDSDHEWLIGMNCLVRLQNWKTQCNLKQWYRGRIIEANENLFTVFLRDYGRTAKVSRVDLMTIPSQLAAPANAVEKCSLNISNTWNESSTRHLHNIIDEYRYFAISSVSKSESSLLVTLWGTSYPSYKEVRDDAIKVWSNINTIEMWDNIGLRIVSQSIIESMNPFIKKSQRQYYRIQSQKTYKSCSDVAEYSDDHTLEELNIKEILLHDNTKPVELIDNDENVADKWFEPVPEWLPPIPMDIPIFDGLVTHITDKGVIYLQEISFTQAAFDLGQSITEHLKNVKLSNVLNHIWQVGDTCFAAFDSDFDNYHRAVIKKINRENGTCLINYVDYGNKAVVWLNDIYPATNFGDIPIFALKLFVPRLVPSSHGKWCPEVMNEFKTRLENKMCRVCIDNTASNEHNRILPCSIEPHILPTNIYKWLLDKKLGYNTGINENGQDVLFV